MDACEVGQGCECFPLTGCEHIRAEKTEFQTELEQLINRHSMENGSNTPDFILAQYLRCCLENFNHTIVAREKWYGRTK